VRACSDIDAIIPSIEGHTMLHMLAIGDPAPDFELPDQDGRAVKLSDLRGQIVVLFFYPKADRKGH
jgi:cytochrome oxidase Cu insertion factor (SCO1/SenC/PrrC family)